MNFPIDKFYSLAEYAGKIKACDFIFKILEDDSLGPDEMSIKLAEYHQECVNEFKKLHLKYSMSNKEVDLQLDVPDNNQ